MGIAGCLLSARPPEPTRKEEDAQSPWKGPAITGTNGTEHVAVLYLLISTLAPSGCYWPSPNGYEYPSMCPPRSRRQLVPVLPACTESDSKQSRGGTPQGACKAIAGRPDCDMGLGPGVSSAQRQVRDYEVTIVGCKNSPHRAG